MFKFIILLGLFVLLAPTHLRAQDNKPKLSGYVQGLYQLNASEDFVVTDNTFKMQRVRTSLTGNIGNHVSYKIQGDWSKSPMLMDAYVKFKACEGFAIQIGQFKTPFTIESPFNPLDLEMFDYGECVRKLGGYDDVCGVGKSGRDIGIMASGDLFPIKDNSFSLLNYSIGVFNGNGMNSLDNNNEKDIVGRLEIHPMLKDITLTGSIYHGTYFKDTDFNGLRSRQSFGAQYKDGRLLIRSEYVRGETGYHEAVVGNDGSINTEDKTFFSTGYYVVAGYWFHFGKEELRRLMPILRYETFTNDGKESNYYTLGLNYWPMERINCKIDYSYIQSLDGSKHHRLVANLSFRF